MTSLISFVLRAGGALAGMVAASFLPAGMMAQAMTALGLGDAAAGGMLAVLLPVVPHALGALFGFLLGSALAGMLPPGDAAEVRTREEAAETVPRLRRHLGTAQGPKAGSPLERLSAPPAGQRVPKHDLSNIPPAPRDEDDQPEFERAPEYANHADGDSRDRFDDGDWDDDRAARTDAAPAPIANDEPSEAFVAEPAAHAPMEDADRVADHPQATFEPSEAVAEAEAEPAFHALHDEPNDDWADPAPFETARFAESARAFEPEPVAPAENIAPESAHPNLSLAPMAPPEPRPAVQETAPRFAPGLTGGMDQDWFSGEADEEEDADDDGAGYGSLMAIGLGRTHKPRANEVSHRPGEANLSPMPLAEVRPVARTMVPQGAGPQDFRLREALDELRRV